MSNDKISDMTPQALPEEGGFVPFVVPGGDGGLDPSKNYRADIGAALTARPTSTQLADDTGASLIGSDDGEGGSLWTTIAGFISYLRSSAGSSIIGFIQSGAGAFRLSAQDKMREAAASIEEFKDVGVSDDVALLRAATARKEIKLKEGETYTFEALADLSALDSRTIFMNGATIEAAASFADLHLLQIRGDTFLIGPGTIDGTNVPGPSNALFPTTPVSISAISKGTTTTVTTSTAHGFKVLEVVEFANVGGMTELNFATNGSERFVVLTTPTTTTFSIGRIQPSYAGGPVDSSAFGTYTSGGTVVRKLDYNAAGYPGVGVFIGGSGENGLVEGVVFQNFQSGPLKNDSRIERNRFRIVRCGFVNVQLDTVAQSNPVVSIETSNYGVVQDCYIDGYNWKGFYYSNGDFNKMVRCHSVGGSSNHASHFITGGNHNSVESCTHDGRTLFSIAGITKANPAVVTVDEPHGLSAGDTVYIDKVGGMTQVNGKFFIVAASPAPTATTLALLGIDSTGYGTYTSGGTLTRYGFGFKMSSTTKPQIVNFLAKECASSGMFQGCAEFYGHSIRVTNPVVRALYIQGEAPAITSGTVRDFWTERATAGSSASHAGIYITAAPGGIVDGVNIINPHVKNMLYGINVANVSFQQTNINVVGGELLANVQYGVLAYIGSGSIRGVRVEMDGAGSPTVPILVISDKVTTDGIIEITENELTGATADNIQLGEGDMLRHRAIRVRSNRGYGGTKFLDYQGNNSTTDAVQVLEVTGNEFSGLTTGDTLTFNTTTPTTLRYDGNTILDTNNSPLAPTFTNLTTNVSVTGATQANPVVITAAGHGLVTGQTGYFADVGGMVELNRLASVTVTVIDANTFSIGVNGTGFTAYTSGGTFIRRNARCTGTRLAGSSTTDVASIAAGAIGTVSIAVPGAELGDMVEFGFSTPLETGLNPTAFVSKHGTAQVNLHNTTGGAIDPASRTYYANVRKRT